MMAFRSPKLSLASDGQSHHGDRELAVHFARGTFPYVNLRDRDDGGDDGDMYSSDVRRVYLGRRESVPRVSS